jgi:hypothetical protein
MQLRKKNNFRNSTKVKKITIKRMMIKYDRVKIEGGRNHKKKSFVKIISNNNKKIEIKSDKNKIQKG